jgi:hypothetical protein
MGKELIMAQNPGLPHDVPLRPIRASAREIVKRRNKKKPPWTLFRRSKLPSKASSLSPRKSGGVELSRKQPGAAGANEGKVNVGRYVGGAGS